MRNSRLNRIFVALTALVVVGSATLLFNHSHEHDDDGHCDACRVVQNQEALPAATAAVEVAIAIDWFDESPALNLKLPVLFSTSDSRAPPQV